MGADRFVLRHRLVHLAGEVPTCVDITRRAEDGGDAFVYADAEHCSEDVLQEEFGQHSLMSLARLPGVIKG